MEMKRNAAAVLPANLEKIAAGYHAALRRERDKKPTSNTPETALQLENIYYDMLDQAVLYRYIARLAKKNSDRMVLVTMRRDIETAAGILYGLKSGMGLTEHITARYGGEKHRFRSYCAGLKIAERRLVTIIDSLMRSMRRGEPDKSALVALTALLYRQINQLSYLMKDCLK